MNNQVAKMIEIKKCIIFDLFDTLVSLEANLAGKAVSAPLDNHATTSKILGVDPDAWNHQLFENSYDRLTGQVKDSFTIIKRLAHAIDPSISDEKIREATGIRMKRFHDAIVGVPGRTLEMLTALRLRGKKLGLVSNADVTEAAAWNESPLSSLFDSAIFSCDVGMMKPEPGIYELSFKQLGCKPNEAVFIGDGSSHELEGAKRIGLTTVLMTGHIATKPALIVERKPFADFVIYSIDELVV